MLNNEAIGLVSFRAREAATSVWAEVETAVDSIANADIRTTIGQRAKNLSCVAERLDTTTTKYGVREMWKYGSGYIWVDDGVVTAISGD